MENVVVFLMNNSTKYIQSFMRVIATTKQPFPLVEVYFYQKRFHAATDIFRFNKFRRNAFSNL